MKKTSYATAIAAALAVLLLAGAACAQQGMMGPGYGMHSGYGSAGPGRTGQGPIDKPTAERILEDYLDRVGNPNLKAGTVEEKGDVYVAEILTVDGSRVDRIEIDKRTGWIRNRHGLTAGMGDRRDDRYGADSRWRYCPYCGGPLEGGRGRHMGGYGPYGDGHGMMGRWDRGGHHRRWDAIPPVDAAAARDIVAGYLDTSRNPNLKIGEVVDKDAYFEVTVVTREAEDLVDTLAVDKRTGYVRSVY